MVKRGGKRRLRQQLKEQQLQQQEQEQEQNLQKEQRRQIRTSSSDCDGNNNNKDRDNDHQIIENHDNGPTTTATEKNRSQQHDIVKVKKLESCDNTTNQYKNYNDNKRIDVTLIWNEKDVDLSHESHSHHRHLIPQPFSCADETVTAITMNEEQTLLFSAWKKYLNNQNQKKTSSSLSSSSSSNNWKPTLIQRQLWSILLNRNNDDSININTVGIAPTGSGKTLSYALPTLINNNNNNEDNDDIVVVVPTRELAHQVSIVYKKIDSNNTIAAARKFL